jgi:hypothetical protein
MFYFPLVLPYLLQLLCIVHIVRTGREYFWIYIIIFVPIVGGLAYIVVEILPSLIRGRGRGLARSPSTYVDIVVRSISPTARLKRFERDVVFSPTHDNKRILADEYLACGDHEKALAIYQALASGTWSKDPELTFLRAKCLYALGKYKEGHDLVAALEAGGYTYRRESDVLVKLKLLERLEPDTAVAAQLYAHYEKKFQSFEIGYYYADFLLRNKMNAEALQVIERFAGVRKQLNSMGMIYDRAWANRMLGLRALARQAPTD